ncbi:MAG: hypothetical protein S4CHLAM45_07500 [Chlamydiales bacterium]|nr:hypothetical protein [Chlamydiales bacterium]MCH9620040.1 hypothetical protein [Chlamydiales bacterium]MCH9622857.1 hypothetical protein [Chlamydiales bacterium]
MTSLSVDQLAANYNQGGRIRNPDNQTPYTCSQVVELFSQANLSQVKASTTFNNAIIKLKGRIQSHYYSGFCGKIRLCLFHLFGWFSFKNHPFAKQLDGISISLVDTILPKKPANIPVDAQVFISENFSSENTIGYLGEGYHKYSITMVDPKEYLSKTTFIGTNNKVDNSVIENKLTSILLSEENSSTEDSQMRWTIERMVQSIEKKSERRFLPLYRIGDSYKSDLDRALAAAYLGIKEIPVFA